MNSNNKLQKDIIKLITDNLKNGNLSEAQIKRQVAYLVNNINVDKDVTRYLQNEINNYNKLISFNVSDFNVDMSNAKKVLMRDTQIIYKQLPTSVVKDFKNLNTMVQELVIAGKLDTNQAIELVAGKYKGATITYSNGAKVPFDKYLEMDYRTNGKEVAKERAMQIGNEIGTDVYQYSTHSNPRKSCAEIEGKLVSTGTTTSIKDGNGKILKVIPLSTTDYGTPGGVLGINCAHILLPFLAGYSKL